MRNFPSSPSPGWAALSERGSGQAWANTPLDLGQGKAEADLVNNVISQELLKYPQQPENQGSPQDPSQRP